MISVIGTLPERHAPSQTVATSATLPPSDATRRGGAGTSRAGPNGRDKRDPPAIGRHAPRRRGHFARRARRSRQARPSRSWTPRAEAARGLRAPGQMVATSATLPPSDATRRGGAGTSRAGLDGRDKRDPPAVGRHAPRRRGYSARRARRSRQARPSRRRTPRAEGEQCEAHGGGAGRRLGTAARSEATCGGAQGVLPGRHRLPLLTAHGVRRTRSSGGASP